MQQLHTILFSDPFSETRETFQSEEGVVILVNVWLG